MDEGTSRIRIGLPPCIVSGDYLASSSHSMLPSLFACACSMSDVCDLGVVLVRLTYCHDPSHGGSYMAEGAFCIRIGLPPRVVSGDCLASSRLWTDSSLPSLLPHASNVS